MFFGPFLPFLPIGLLLNMLPEAIGEPMKAVLLDIMIFYGEILNGIVSLIF